MKKKYSIKVDETFDYQFDKTEINAVDAIETSPKHYHVLESNRSYKAEIINSDFLSRNYTVRINSNNYNVNIANALDMLIEEMGLELKAVLQVNELNAPMPGLILEIDVKEGDEVKEGDVILVLEAMKMENALAAPRDGVVKSISVKKGETVEKNQLLIEMM